VVSTELTTVTTVMLCVGPRAVRISLIGFYARFCFNIMSLSGFKLLTVMSNEALE